MKEALSKILGSAKFWTTIIGSVLTAGASLIAKHGLEVSDDAVRQVAITISGLFVVLLGAQGATDFGKNAAIENAKSMVPQQQVIGQILQTEVAAPASEPQA